MNLHYLVRCTLIAAIFAIPVSAQSSEETSADTTAIVANALDYIEGWYEGNAERMERALHPEVAKRIVTISESGSQLGQMTAEMLITSVRRGGGRNTPEVQRQRDVTVLDIFEETAVVKIVASTWIDYLQVAKWNGEWKIINVLWTWKPR